MKLISWILIQLINAYQVTIGPHFGGRCRFVPSCSNYSREAIQVHGPVKGLWLSFRRVVRCGPWTRGGFDPVPPFGA